MNFLDERQVYWHIEVPPDDNDGDDDDDDGGGDSSDGDDDERNEEYLRIEGLKSLVNFGCMLWKPRMKKIKIV